MVYTARARGRAGRYREARLDPLIDLHHDVCSRVEQGPEEHVPGDARYAVDGETSRHQYSGQLQSRSRLMTISGT
jgi:hypothetical protein